MASWLQDVLKRSEAGLASAERSESQASPRQSHPTPPPALRAQFGDYAEAAEIELSQARASEDPASQDDRAADLSAAETRMATPNSRDATSPWRLRDALANASEPALEDKFAIDDGSLPPEERAPDSETTSGLFENGIPVSAAELPMALREHHPGRQAPPAPDEKSDA